jgi:adsorption protein B
MVLIWPLLRLAEAWKVIAPLPPEPLVKGLLLFNLLSFFWRLSVRAVLTGAEYGWVEGVRAILRFPVGNVITIIAGRRALAAYVRVLFGGRLQWDHTVHLAHPASPPRPKAEAPSVALAQA